MEEVVFQESGTGIRAQSAVVGIAGKTGTAQVSIQSTRNENKLLPKGLSFHAWFAAMAPVDNPRIVVVVLVEHGGAGGEVAAPIAKKVIEEFFQKTCPQCLYH
jgi:penicillin-binding protein 2